MLLDICDYPGRIVVVALSQSLHEICDRRRIHSLHRVRSLKHRRSCSTTFVMGIAVTHHYFGSCDLRRSRTLKDRGRQLDICDYHRRSHYMRYVTVVAFTPCIVGRSLKHRRTFATTGDWRRIYSLAFVGIVAFALWHLRPSSQLLLQGSSYSLLSNCGHHRIRSLKLRRSCSTHW